MIGIKLTYLTLLMKIESYTYFIAADINSTVHVISKRVLVLVSS